MQVTAMVTDYACVMIPSLSRKYCSDYLTRDGIDAHEQVAGHPVKGPVEVPNDGRALLIGSFNQKILHGCS